MRNIFYLILTFLICYILKLPDVWLGFSAALLILSFFRFEDSFLWEIPLAVLGCGVLKDAFAQELDTMLKILLPCAAVIIAYSAPKRLWVFFPIAIWAVFYNNVYALSAMTAGLWFGVRRLAAAASDNNERTFHYDSILTQKQ